MHRRHLFLSVLFALPLHSYIRRSGTKARRGWVLRKEDT